MTQMATDDISARLIALVRAHLKFLPAGEELTMDMDLNALGLDSMGSINLLVELEEAFDIMIPDEMLGAAIFGTCASLDKAVRSLLNS